MDPALHLRGHIYLRLSLKLHRPSSSASSRAITSGTFCQLKKTRSPPNSHTLLFSLHKSPEDVRKTWRAHGSTPWLQIFPSLSLIALYLYVSLSHPGLSSLSFPLSPSETDVDSELNPRLSTFYGIKLCGSGVLLTPALLIDTVAIARSGY